MHCQIRTWRESDAPALARALNNRKVMDNLRDGLPYPYTEADALDYIRAMLCANQNDTFAYAIVDTEHDMAIGSIGVFRQSNIHRRTAELGYYIAEPYWGRGWMTEAVRQVCKDVFAKSDILRIFAEPFAENAGSCRVLEKNGFVLEGILHQNAVKNGRVRDMKLYAKLRA